MKNPNGGENVMNFDEKGISPVVGTILLVAVTVIIAGSIAAFVYGLSGDTEAAPSANLSFDGVRDNESSFEIAHDGGDTITDAFEVNGNDNFVDLKVTVDGSSVSGENIEGDVGNGNSDFEAGEVIEINLSGSSIDPLKEDNTIRVVYEPTGTILASTTVE